MKKTGIKRATWLRRRQRVTILNLLRTAGKSKHYRTLTGLQLSKSKPVVAIQFPASLIAETEEHREAILSKLFFAVDALTAGNSVRFDFTRTRKAYPGGMLVVLAYVELMLEMFPGKVSAISPPGTLITQLLQHFGFAERLSMICRGTTPVHESVVNWRFLTGSQADGPKITELLSVYKTVSDAEIPEGLYDVLAEALTNVRHHAYPEGNSQTPESLRRWWLFSRYEVPEASRPGRLYLAVYDIGVGIQASLRNKLSTGEIVLDKADSLLRILKLEDNLIIERLLLKRAVEELRTSTGLSNRGKGLPEMREFVMGTDSGRMYIISGRGQYTCVASEQNSDAFGCKIRFPGTLILWSIPLGIKLKES